MKIQLSLESFSKRLVILRSMRRYSIVDFHSMLNDSISLANYIKMEIGLYDPSNELFYLIASKLQISPKYLCKEFKVNLDGVNFENLYYLYPKDQTAIINYTRFNLERIIELELKLSPRNTCLEKLKEVPIHNAADIETAATTFRDLLGIGYKSIANLSRILEEEHIKIIPYTKLHNFESTSSCFDLKHYVIVFNNNLEHHTVEDSRLFLLREIAQLFLDLSAVDEGKRNKICYQFALAVLLPLNFVHIYFGEKRKSIYTSELKYINSYFGISPIAILNRIYLINIISRGKFHKYRATYNKTYLNIKTHSYKSAEDLYGFDHLLIQAIVNKRITEFEAAEFRYQNQEDFQKEYLDSL
jgi:hypothetical protein